MRTSTQTSASRARVWSSSVVVPQGSRALSWPMRWLRPPATAKPTAWSGTRSFGLRATDPSEETGFAVRLAIVDLGQIPVVGAAHQPEVIRSMIATVAVGTTVVELQVLTRSAALATRTDETTAPAIALIDGSPDGSGNIARPRRRFRAHKLLSRILSLRKAAGFQACQLFRHRLLDEGCEIPIRH